MFYKEKIQKGFTLVEILVVIAIISLLSSVVYVSLGSSKVKAEDAKKVAEVNQVEKAIRAYEILKNERPEGSPGQAAVEGTDAYNEALGTLVTEGFLSDVPDSPDDSYYIIFDGSGFLSAFGTQLDDFDNNDLGQKTDPKACYPNILWRPMTADCVQNGICEPYLCYDMNQPVCGDGCPVDPGGIPVDDNGYKIDPNPDPTITWTGTLPETGSGEGYSSNEETGEDLPLAEYAEYEKYKQVPCPTLCASDLDYCACVLD